MKLKFPKAKGVAHWSVILLVVAVIGFFLVVPTVFAVNIQNLSDRSSSKIGETFGMN